MKKLIAGVNPVGAWIGAWVRLGDALVVILTLGFYQPTWAIRFFQWKIETRNS